MAHTSIESDLRTLVLSLTGVTSYIGTGASARLYFVSATDTLPESQVFPYIVYSTIAADGSLQFIGTRSSSTLIQFSVFHTHKTDGLDLANALFDGLSAYHGTPSAKKVYFTVANGPRVIKDPDYDNIYQFIVDVTVDYER